MRKLTLVVTCTERKTLPASPTLAARNLPAGSVESRAERWLSALASAPELRPLDRLYQGAAWSQVRALRSAAMRAGFDPTVIVASAGLGLRGVDHQAPGYAATFSPRSTDLVAPAESTGRWWRALSCGSDALAPVATLRGRIVMVLSGPYAQAMRDDISAAATSGAEILLVGGAQDLSGVKRLPSDAALCTELGGTAGTIALRMASAWLGRLGDEPLTSQVARRHWDEWALRARSPRAWNRIPQSDPQVRSHIVRMLASDPALTKTAALRRLRDEGVACEQKRFGVIFTEISAASSGRMPSR